MSERATRIGSRLIVWSEPHVGTEVELRVPARAAFGASRQPRRAPADREREAWT